MSQAIEHHEHHDAGSKVIFGFWVYIMTDCILFATLFATYAVLRNNTYGAPGIQEITHLPLVLTETLLLLVSTFIYGLGSAAMHKDRLGGVMLALIITFVLGLAFADLEYHQFSALVQMGASWKASAFLSSFFGLVGLHWVHVIVGLVWMLVLMMQLCLQKLSTTMKTRLICLGMFWNFLNILWIFIFTIVYLMGVI